MRCVRHRVATAPLAGPRRAFASTPTAPPFKRSQKAPASRQSPTKESDALSALMESAEGKLPKRKPSRRENLTLRPPAPYIIMGSQTILHTLQTNPTSVEEIIIEQDKLKNPRISSIAHLAHESGITIKEATKQRVNELSRNSRQDQGIVAKVKPLNIIPLENYLGDIKFGPSALVALDGVTNPQNIGMMLRSFAAGDYINGVIIPRHSCPPASHPLVIKASAGTVLHSKVKILDCMTVEDAIIKCNVMGFSVVGLDQRGSSDIFEYTPPARVVYVIGNESTGLNARMRTLLTKRLRIPMGDNVESLNVAVAASFIGYLKHFRGALPLPASAGLPFRSRRPAPKGAKK